VPAVPADTPRDPALAALLTAREGTGAAFPAALSSHLREAGGERSLTSARAWAADPDPAVVLVALELLGALTAPWSPPPPQGAVEELLAQADRALARPEEDLRWVAAKVLGRGGPGALPALLVLAGEGDPDVRWQALSSLPLLAEGLTGRDRARLVQALMVATRDEDDEVRDQAVFALALQLEDDSPAIRDVLSRAAQDPERSDTAGQAARGLALRGDARAMPAVLGRLGAEDPEEVEETWVEAAGDLADPALLPALHRLQEAGWAADEGLVEVLGAALAACGGHGQRADGRG
jgi:HEAT repeat protein